MKEPVKAIFFDLDDTLMDTSGQLVPIASKDSCEQMIQKGLNATLDSCLEQRREFYLSKPEKNIYHLMVEHFGVNKNVSANEVAQTGEEVFLKRKIPLTLELYDGVKEGLTYLKSKYLVFLVSAGNPETQMAKVKALDISVFFDEIIYVDTFKKQSKKQAFENLLSKFNLIPTSCISVGNRLDNEIAEAKVLGMQTCHMALGMHADFRPRNSLEMPDYKVLSIRELVKVCQL